MRWLGWAVGLAVLAAVGGGSCGSGGGEGNNDQGISFRAVGFFQGTVEENKCTIPTVDQSIVDTAFVISLNNPFIDPGFPPFLASCIGFLELQNNLFNQAITVTALTFEYEIPGVDFSDITSSGLCSTDPTRLCNTAPNGQRINPANCVDPSGSPCVAPSGAPNVIFYQPTGQLIPSTIVLFLRQNILSLPPLPFPMIIRTTAFGVADNGDEFVSNEVSYTVEFLP